MRRQHFMRGDVIFAMGDPSAYAYVIESGTVEIYQHHGGERVVLGILGPGEIFGEMSLVDELPRSAHARVLDDAYLCAVTADEFIELLFDDPDEGLRYLRALFERLRSMNERVGQGEIRDSQIRPEEKAAGESSVVIYAASDKLHSVLPESGQVIRQWPFHVGRASAILGSNDLEVFDSKPYNVSRRHFALVRDGAAYLVRDRGSYLGTIVNGERIGSKRSRGEAPLRPGDNTVIAGDSASPFVFRIRVEP